MLFKATGQNSQTGARMVLEIEANSKGAAEHKAEQAGMYVTHCAPADSPSERRDRRPAVEQETTRAGRKLFISIAVLLILLIAAWLLWPQLRAWIDL